MGICGGCQMLGRTVADPERVESNVVGAEGLGLLPIVTRFTPEKRTTQVRARLLAGGLLGEGGAEVCGYEIHMGRVEREDAARGALVIHTRNGLAEDDIDGAVSSDGAVLGTMVHGLFDDA